MPGNCLTHCIADTSRFFLRLQYFHLAILAHRHYILSSVLYHHIEDNYRR